MPIARIQLPDGRIGRFEVPEGTTPEQVLSFANQQSGPAPEPELPKPAVQGAGISRTMLEQGMQGATFNTSDEIINPLGAVAAGIYENPRKFFGSMLRGETPEVSPELNEELVNAKGNTQARMQAQMEERPALSIGSNIAGALLTGGAAGTTKAGGAAINSLRSGPLWARTLKGTGAGAVSGGLYGAGAADEGSRLEGANRGAVLGAVAGGALPVAGAIAGSAAKGTKNAVTGAFARSADELDTAAAAIKDTSSKAYQAMRSAGAIINRPRAVNIANRVQAAVTKSGQLNPRLHSTTMGLLDDFKAASQQADFTLEDLDQWRQVFGQVAGNFNDTYNKRTASIAIDAIDDAVGKLSKIDIKGGRTDAIDALNLGRSEWARSRKFERIADIVKKSEGDANYLKREFKKIVNTPKLQRGFNAGEMAAIREAAKSTVADDMVLKTLGRFGFDYRRIGTGVGAAVGSGVGYGIAGGGAALAIPVAGTAARQLRSLTNQGKAENILKAIEGAGGKNLPAIPKRAVSALLSPPAGAAAGTIAGAESRAPARAMPIQEPPYIPAGVLPPGPQSNNLQTPADSSADLFTRVIQQESGGQQFRKNGNPIISPKGAVGIAQIMPKTGPDAAKAAGLPYDAKRLYSDPEYNAALGKAYLGKMQSKYQNNMLALMAYNWGPGNVDMWLKGGAKVERVPAETKNYVRNILGNT